MIVKVIRGILEEFSLDTNTAKQEDFENFRKTYEKSKIKSLELVFEEGLDLNDVNDLLSDADHSKVKEQVIFLKDEKTN